MTGRRVRIQAVVLVVVVVVSVGATGAVVAGTTVAQSNGADNAGGGGGNGGSGGPDSAGGDSGNGGSGGPDNAGGGSGNGGSGGSDSAASGSGNGGSGSSGNAAGGARGNTTPGADTSDGNASRPDVDDTGPPANSQAANRTGREIAEVVKEVSRTTPDAVATVDIEDRRPDTPGLTVTPGTATETVSAVTLTDEDLRGTVDIKEYKNPPRAVTESITETVARNITPAPTANDIVGNDSDANETTANGSTATDRVNVVTVANISVFDEFGEKATDTAATVSMDIDTDDVADPEDATVVHETDSGWETLDTSVVNATNETVTLAAETGGFSLFAVAEIDDDDEGSPRRSGSDETGDTTPGFGVQVALAVIAGVTLLTWRSVR